MAIYLKKSNFDATKEVILMKKVFKEEPLCYWEEKSYMMVIPEDDTKNILNDSLGRISKIAGVKIIDTNYDIEGCIYLTIEYQKRKYEVGIYQGPISVPEYYLNRNFLFKKQEAEAILNARIAVNIFMKFSEDIKTSFHLQLKLGVAIVPDLIGVLDESAERMLPAKWVKLTAASKILPSSKDLFNIQAVTKGSKVWLHTHGLCRCHTTELEILESDQKNYRNHYNLLSIYAMYILDAKEPFDPRTAGSYVGQLINGYPVVVTCRSWTESLDLYRKLHIGGEKDRRKGHNTKSSVIFLYKSEKDEKENKLSKISDYDDFWGENPLFFFSDEETWRMKALAMERFEYVKKAFDEDNYPVLMKIGLPLKEKGKFEHIWFELLEIKGKKFRAKLTQEPYDVKDIHTGDEKWFTVDDITDWLIYAPFAAIAPSDAYLLDE